MGRSSIAATVLAAGLALVGPAPHAVAGTPEAAPAETRAGGGIAGTWTGPVVNQDGPAGYTATVRLVRTAGAYRATVRYSEGLPSTRWVYRGRDGAQHRFREISSTGDRGAAVTVVRRGARLLVKYRLHGYRGHVLAHRAR